MYYVSSDADAGTMNNIPRVASGKLIVMARHTASYLVQYHYPSTAAFYRYVRSYYTGSGYGWGAWIMEEVSYANNCPKQFSMGVLSSSSVKTFEQLGLSSYPYGAYLVAMRSDGAPDGSWVGFVRHNAAGYQISEVYKGQATTTPYFTSDGIAKTDNSTGVACAALVFPIQVWGNPI